MQKKNHIQPPPPFSPILFPKIYKYSIIFHFPPFHPSPRLSIDLQCLLVSFFPFDVLHQILYVYLPFINIYILELFS